MQNKVGAALAQSLNVHEYVHKHPHIVDKLSLVIRKVRYFQIPAPYIWRFSEFFSSLWLQAEYLQFVDPTIHLGTSS